MASVNTAVAGTEDSRVLHDTVSASNESNLSMPNSSEPADSDINSRQRIFKIIVIGDSGVGKTCLTFRFCSGRFPERSEATIGVDFREKNMLVGDDSVKLQIWDTAGQEKFRKSMVQHYYRNVHAVIFVYDITKRSTFDNLINWIDECDANNLSDNIPRILVGNKCDLQDEVVIPTNAAQCFADSYNMPLFETSAKDGSMSDHIESIFLTVAHKLKNHRPMMKAPHAQTTDVVIPRSSDYSRTSVNLNQSREPTSSCVCSW